MNKIKLVCLVGASGSGKTTILRYLQKKYPEFRNEIISDTTREIRPGEENGVDYNFMNSLNGEYIESVTFNGNSYGVSVRELVSQTEKAKRYSGYVTVIVNIHGFIQIEKYLNKEGLLNVYKLVPVYVNVSLETLTDRLEQRNSPERLEVVEKEVEEIESTVKNRNDFITISNQNNPVAKTAEALRITIKKV